MKIDIPHHLSDEELEAQLKALARGEQEATARLISRLAEFDARRLYLPAGFSRAAGCEHGGGPALGQSVVGALTGAGETPDRQAARATDRYEIRFTATAETREKLRLAQDLLRPAVPTGDVAQVIDRALTLLIEDQRRKKIGATDRPRTSRGTAPGRRGVAAKVRRTAWNHDEGRCSFVSK